MAEDFNLNNVSWGTHLRDVKRQNAVFYEVAFYKVDAL